MQALLPSIRLKINHWLWLIGALGVWIISQFPDLVTRFYTRGFFKILGVTLRTVSGIIPFALGEIIYIFLIITLIYKLLRYIIDYKSLIKKRIFWTSLIHNAFWGLLKLYVLFQLFWGLNYAQQQPAKSFGIDVKYNNKVSIPQEQLQTLLDAISLELNRTRLEIADQSILRMTKTKLEQIIMEAYQAKGSEYPFLKFASPNFKYAFIPSLGDYIGYLAFYQPITGEAIIRNDLPLFTQPFTMAHELAHQMGYASETEANFIAYVVSDGAQSALLRYSMLLQIYQYVQAAQLSKFIKEKEFDGWKSQIIYNRSQLSLKVLKDQKSIRAFFNKRAENQIASATQLYDQFLIWNKQSNGIQSYADVVGWVLAYRMKTVQLKTGSSTSYSQ